MSQVRPAHVSPRMIGREGEVESIAFAKRREKQRKARKAAKLSKRRNR